MINFNLLLVLLIFTFLSLTQCRKPYPIECSSASYGYCSFFTINDDFEPVNVISNDLCTYQQYCNITDPQKSGNIIVNGQCILKSTASYKSYPGETCSQNSDCINNNCISYYCKAHSAEGELCGDDIECNAGLFCLLDSNAGNKFSTCQKQKDEGELCYDSYNCKNSLLCTNGKCTSYFSFKNGEEVNVQQDYLFGDLQCESGSRRFDSATNKTICDDLFYLSKDKNPLHSSKLCSTLGQINDTCSVFYGNNTSLKDYECTTGFSADATGYCPEVGVTSDKKSFIQEYKTNNSLCHTRNRLNCLRTNSINFDFDTKYGKAFFAHRLINVPDCVTANISPQQIWTQ